MYESISRTPRFDDGSHGRYLVPAGKTSTILPSVRNMASAFIDASADSFLTAILAVNPDDDTLILDAASYRKTDLLWAAVVVSMLLAFLIFSATTAVEKRLTAWRS